MTSDLPTLPKRPAAGHKGTFGTVCVVGGQAAEPKVMLGGPAFSAIAALRSGAGLAVLAVPSPILAEALTVAPSATGLALPVDENAILNPSEVAALLDEHRSGYGCIAVGPGLGEGVAQQQIVMRLIGRDEVPLVIDADAINALAAVPNFFEELAAPAIFTPHPGEYRRIASALNLEVDPIDEQSRIEAAKQLAQRLGCVVVLKGAGTVITDGIEASVNTTGNVALATAGTGDVLTGIIAGLVSQFFTGDSASLSLYDCARLGVYIHGLAADRWAKRSGESGLLANDLLVEIPLVMDEIRKGG
ncbi:MAG: NAD(P)H-hydrate dehydratase [Planctomycetes bacterium]|nr:NAD(P)H-hydrate dehydratase [Planctomycetota bacterium]